MVNRQPSAEQQRRLNKAEEVSFLPMEAIGGDGELDISQTRDKADVANGYTQFFDGDVLIAKITPCFENGKGALVSGLLNGVGFGTTELHVLNPGSRLDARFLYYITKSVPFRQQGEAAITGAAGQKRVPEEFVRDYPVPVLALREQGTIADFLDRETGRLDALMTAKEQWLELLAEKRRALITRAVMRGLNPAAPLRDSVIPWFGKVPEHWEVPPVYARFEVQLGKMLDEKRIKGTHLAPYIRNVDVQWAKINTFDLPEMDFDEKDRQKYSLRKGDILVCEGGEIGRCALWNGEFAECYFQKAIHRLRPKSERDLAEFFILVMRTLVEAGIFSSQANASTIQHLPAEKLRVLRFPSPPLGEQRAIVAHISAETAKIDALRTATERTIALLKERRAALIAAAVTGRIEVGLGKQ